ncbi:hypothetical protein Pelo_2410 [Pelomyxa schiedti]|nr:hypothetical protein Pelo_2410 [Pelomyxa schiedti]
MWLIVRQYTEEGYLVAVSLPDMRTKWLYWFFTWYSDDVDGIFAPPSLCPESEWNSTACAPVILGLYGRPIALNPWNGTTIWEKESIPGYYAVEFAVSDDAVYILWCLNGMTTNLLESIDIHTGNTKWNLTLIGGDMSSLLVENEIIYLSQRVEPYDLGHNEPTHGSVAYIDSKKGVLLGTSYPGAVLAIADLDDGPSSFILVNDTSIILFPSVYELDNPAWSVDAPFTNEQIFDSCIYLTNGEGVLYVAWMDSGSFCIPCTPELELADTLEFFFISCCSDHGDCLENQIFVHHSPCILVQVRVVSVSGQGWIGFWLLPLGF